MATRVFITFPYSGAKGKVRERLTQLIEETLNPQGDLHTSNRKPVLVVNRDTIARGRYEEFEIYLDDERKKDLLDELDVIKVWAVDTCQMWLNGYGKIIDDKLNDPKDDTTSVLQIPGDLEDVPDFPSFLNSLSDLRRGIENDWDFAIGDFDVESQGSKHLIDVYGTYPLFFNWFPDIARTIRHVDRIQRPRSEFIGATIEFLSKMLLLKRKFAYEQTMVFLIHALSDRKRRWRIGRVDLGTIKDFEAGRGFRAANDQIERTERMLKLLWREMNGGDKFNIRDFERLDRRSTAIREAAIVSLENFLT